MIARIWQGRTRPGMGKLYLSYLDQTGLKEYKATEGFKDFLVLTREIGDVTEYVLITLWDSMEAVRRFAGPEPERAVYYPEDDRYFPEEERTPFVRHYEVGARYHGYMQTVFEASGGNDGLRRLAYAWHKRVMADDVVAHAFSHGFHPQHVERLAAYWAEALGGPTTYSDSYGDETSVVKMHSGNGEHDEMNRLAIACFDLALADVGLANDDVLRQVLHDYFAWATTTTMSRYHQSADVVPDGLSIPHWSWDGLQE